MGLLIAFPCIQCDLILKQTLIDVTCFCFIVDSEKAFCFICILENFEFDGWVLKKQNLQLIVIL